MQFSQVLGQITLQGLFKALRDVAAILYIAYNVIVYIMNLVRSYKE